MLKCDNSNSMEEMQLVNNFTETINMLEEHQWAEDRSL